MIDGLPSDKFAPGLCFARVTRAAGALGLDLASFAERSLLIVGSNGKGTTAAAVAAALQTQRAKVGLFTSPHVMSVTERVRLNGAPIDLETLQRLSRAVAAAQTERLGAFEHLFLTAALWFQEEACDAIIWEAGIGGRYDCTRLVGARHGALVSLDLEHTALLGDTLELIACDKLDGFAPGALIQCGASCRPLAATLNAFAGLTQKALAFPALPTGAGFLEHNQALAVAAAAAFLGEPPTPELAAAAGEAHLPGRLETVARNPLTLIDIGHTPAAARAARSGFEALAGPSGALILGVSAGKKAGEIAAVLAPGFARVACVQSRYGGRPAEEILALVRKAAPDAQSRAFVNVDDAYSALRREGRAILACGSLYAAAEVKALASGLDPAGLWFL